MRKSVKDLHCSLEINLGYLFHSFRIYHTMLPMAEAYLSYLDAVKNVESNRQLLAGRSNRSWALDVGKVLATLREPECLARLRLIGDDVDMETDHQDARLWFSLCVSTASHRCWSMAVHSELPPDQWFGILDNDQNASTMACSKMASCFRLIDKANKSLRGDPDYQAPSPKAKEALGVPKSRHLI